MSSQHPIPLMIHEGQSVQKQKNPVKKILQLLMVLFH